MYNKSILIIGNFLSETVIGLRSPSEDLAKELAGAGWRVITASSRNNRLGRVLDMLAITWRRRRDYTLALVDVYSGAAFYWAEGVYMILRMLGKPFILTLHGGNLPDFARRHPRRVRRLLAAAAVVTTPSNYLQKEMKVYGDGLCLLPNPLYLKAYPFRARVRPEPRLVWVRAFHSMYNPQLAPQVIARLSSEFPEIELIMLGPHKGDASLEQTRQVAEAVGVFNHIYFPGVAPKEKVPSWLSHADIFLNTTFVDNTPVSVMEAMACGLCVVSTLVGGIPYLVEHEKDALLVPPNDPEAMAAAVRRILREPGLAERLSRNARKKAEQFDWSLILPQWKKLIASVEAL